MSWFKLRSSDGAYPTPADTALFMSMRRINQPGILSIDKELLDDRTPNKMMERTLPARLSSQQAHSLTQYWRRRQRLEPVLCVTQLLSLGKRDCDESAHQWWMSTQIGHHSMKKSYQGVVPVSSLFSGPSHPALRGQVVTPSTRLAEHEHLYTRPPIYQLQHKPYADVSFPFYLCTSHTQGLLARNSSNAFQTGKVPPRKSGLHRGVNETEIIAITLLANAEVIEQLLTESELAAAVRGCWGYQEWERNACHVKSFYTFVTRPAPRDVIAVSLCLGPEYSANAAGYWRSAFLMFAQTSSTYRWIPVWLNVSITSLLCHFCNLSCNVIGPSHVWFCYLYRDNAIVLLFTFTATTFILSYRIILALYLDLIVTVPQRQRILTNWPGLRGRRQSRGAVHWNSKHKNSFLTIWFSAMGPNL